jgi:hypothetical protein
MPPRTGRKTPRLREPAALPNTSCGEGGTSRSKYHNKFIYLTGDFQPRTKALTENVVNEVITIMVNEPLRAAPRVASRNGPC